MALESTPSKTSKLDNNNLEAFNWDKVTPDGKETEFFGNETKVVDNAETEDVTDIIEREEEVEEDDEKSEEEQENEQEEENESQVEENEEQEESTKKKTKEKDKETVVKKEATKVKEITPGDNESDNDEDTPKELYAALLVDLKENGNLEFVEIPKKKKLTRKEFFELQSKNDEARVDATLKDLFEGLDEKATDFLKFIKAGGKTEDFIDTYVNNVIPDLDVEDVKTHDDILAYYYSVVENQTPDEVKESIEADNEAGKELKAKKAKRYYKKMKEQEEAEKQELLEKTQKKNAKLIREAQEFSTKLKTITTRDEVDGVPLNGEDKKTLADYATKPTKILNGNKVPAWQHDFNKLLKDEVKFVKFLKLLKNDFNLDFIKVKATSKVASTTRKELERMQSGGKDLNNKSASTKKSLADYFEG